MCVQGQGRAGGQGRCVYTQLRPDERVLNVHTVGGPPALLPTFSCPTLPSEPFLKAQLRPDEKTALEVHVVGASPALLADPFSPYHHPAHALT